MCAEVIADWQVVGKCEEFIRRILNRWRATVTRTLLVEEREIVSQTKHSPSLFTSVLLISLFLPFGLLHLSRFVSLAQLCVNQAAFALFDTLRLFICLRMTFY